MKALLLTILITSNLLTIATSFAAAIGNSSGGGGDASEVRVNEIRSDILQWINNGGAKKLRLPRDLSYENYVKEMKEILKPKKVVISFTNKKVVVGEVEKTCKGFVSKKLIPNIRCNITRFKGTPESAQYSLIHHEYAGLTNIENNDAGASDYEISSQLMGFLEETTVLKLAVKEYTETTTEIKKNQVVKNVVICSTQCQDESIEHLGHDAAKVGVIYYAPATPENLENSNLCFSQSKQIDVTSNRMTNYSSNTCMNALAGKYKNKKVNIYSDKHAAENDEGTYFAVEIVK